jgi:hypothetical protein
MNTDYSRATPWKQTPTPILTLPVAVGCFLPTCSNSAWTTILDLETDPNVGMNHLETTILRIILGARMRKNVLSARVEEGSRIPSKTHERSESRKKEPGEVEKLELTKPIVLPCDSQSKLPLTRPLSPPRERSARNEPGGRGNQKLTKSMFIPGPSRNRGQSPGVTNEV